jgi:hypothetical protein
MALDQHHRGYSPSCPICQAKILFNGTQAQDANSISFYPEIAYHHFLKSFSLIAIPVALSFQNRAPPDLSLC